MMMIIKHSQQRQQQQQQRHQQPIDLSLQVKSWCCSAISSCSLLNSQLLVKHTISASKREVKADEARGVGQIEALQPRRASRQRQRGEKMAAQLAAARLAPIATPTQRNTPITRSSRPKSRTRLIKVGFSAKFILLLSFTCICLTLLSTTLAISAHAPKCIIAPKTETEMEAAQESDANKISGSSDVGDQHDDENSVANLRREDAELQGEEAGELVSGEQMRLMSTRLPRQQFRNQALEPASARKASPFKLIKIQSTKGRHTTPKQSESRKGEKVKSISSTGSSGSSSGSSNGDRNDTSRPANKLLQKGTGKKISSAALRMLLSQTLPKLDASSSSSSNSNSNSFSKYSSLSLPLNKTTNLSSQGAKSAHFKFVFIQRATQAPSSNSKGAGTGTKKARDSIGLANPSKTVYKQAANNSHDSNNNNNSGQQQPSLAASVSKQLASSLFYSAASLVGNLTSSSSSSSSSSLLPSLSALASMAAQRHFNNHQVDSSGHQSTSGPSKLDQSASLTTSSLHQTSTARPAVPSDENSGGGNTGDNDIRRLSDHSHSHKTSAPIKSVLISSLSSPSSSSSSSATKTKTNTKTKSAKSRPSKIYNLPVKFVANGQANHVVFHAIKQHFATIKRLQQSVQSSASASRGQSLQSSATGKRKKFNGGGGAGGGGGSGQGTRLKGKNSRLIYLPLKYLSNAKPSMLNVIVGSGVGGGTKASHKSTTSALTKSKN